MWTIGMTAGFALSGQILTGLVVCTEYIGGGTLSWDSVQYLLADTGMGWGTRLVHGNGAGLFLLSL